MTIILGIDPGRDGGAAIISTISNGLSLEIFPFKSKHEFINIGPLMRAIEELCFHGVYYEQVHAMPHDGVSSAFTFGRAYGQVEGILIANNIPWENVTPQKWQVKLDLAGPYPTRYERKQAHQRRAKQLFPHEKITLPVADAVLIAYYGYLKTLEERNI